MTKNASNGNGKTAMTVSAASRIQSSIAKASAGAVSSGSFAARAQRAAVANSVKATK
jgi:hypothetical protein